MQAVFPDYDHSVLNITASIGRFFGIPSDYPSLPALDRALAAAPQTVVLLVFDGMGIDALDAHLPPDSFLQKNRRAALTSVYPSTTTAAMTAYYSGLSPNEHGWLGWSLYFKEYGRLIDTFLSRDSMTGQPLTAPDGAPIDAARAVMPYSSVFEKIRDAGNAVPCHTVFPENIRFPESPSSFEAADLGGFFGRIAQLAREPGRKYLFGYWPEPDATMHMHGCRAPQTAAQLRAINDGAEALCAGLTDALVIVSADHGLLDITQEVCLNELPELCECLRMPPCVETRAVSLFVKPDRRTVFEERFSRLFPDFLLLSRDEVFRRELLGRGVRHRKTDDFVGDYLACALGARMLRYLSPISAPRKPFAANHAGLTPQEMLVPLIFTRRP